MVKKIQIEQSVLDNGMVVISDYVPETELVYASLVFHSGAWHDFKSLDSNDPANPAVEFTDKNGRAHLAEHMVMHGNVDMSWDEIQAVMQANNVDFNLQTGADFTRYFADGFREPAMQYMAFIAGALTDKAYDDQYDMELARITDEMRNTHNRPDVIESALLSRARFKGLVNGEPLNGLPETFPNINLADIHDWHDRTHVTDNATFIVTGNMTHAEVRDQAQALFMNLPRGKRSILLEPESSSRINFSETVAHRPNTTGVFIGFKGRCAPSDIVALNIFVNECNLPIRQKVQNRMGLYHHAVESGTMGTKNGMVYFSFETQPEKVRDTVFATIETLQEVLESLSESRFEQIKRNRLVQTATFLARSWYDLKARANSIQEASWMYGDPAHFTRIPEHVAALTLKDMKTAVHRVLADCFEASYLGAQRSDFPTTDEIQTHLPSSQLNPAQVWQARARRFTI